MSGQTRIAVFIAASLDGFIAGKDGDLSFLDRVQAPGEDYGYQAFFDAVDVVVVGRRTYETAAAFSSWPYAGKRVVVVTHRPIDDARVVRHDGPVLALAPTLAGRVYVDGGDVIRQFLAAKLVDEITVSIVPVLLGTGARLFEGVTLDLELAGCEAYDSGLVQVQYRRR